MRGSWGKANADLQELKSLLENPESLLVNKIALQRINLDLFNLEAFH